MKSRQTSIDAFKDILKGISKRQSTVLTELYHSGPLSNRQLATRLGWEINCITPRVNELVKKGLVVNHDTHVDSGTNKHVIRWICQG